MGAASGRSKQSGLAESTCSNELREPAREIVKWITRVGLAKSPVIAERHASRARDDHLTQSVGGRLVLSLRASPSLPQHRPNDEPPPRDFPQLGLARAKNFLARDLVGCASNGS